MATFSPMENRPFCKKLYVRAARGYMLRQGFGHDWIETYALRLAGEIDAAASDVEMSDILRRVFLLAKSPPPIAWMGA